MRPEAAQGLEPGPVASDARVAEQPFNGLLV